MAATEGRYGMKCGRSFLMLFAETCPGLLSPARRLYFWIHTYYRYFERRWVGRRGWVYRTKLKGSVTASCISLPLLLLQGNDSFGDKWSGYPVLTLWAAALKNRQEWLWQTWTLDSGLVESHNWDFTVDKNSHYHVAPYCPHSQKGMSKMTPPMWT